MQKILYSKNCALAFTQTRVILTSMPFILRKTLSETFVERVKTTPHSAAFGYLEKTPETPEEPSRKSWKTLTFLEFEEQCKKVSYGLMSLGVKPKDRVAILSNTRFEWALFDIATLGASAITVPIYASSSPEDVSYILSHSEAKILILENGAQLEKIRSICETILTLEKIVLMESPKETQKEPNIAKTTQFSKETLSLEKLKVLGATEENKDATRFTKNLLRAEPEDLLTICYTSGTTGIPKGVMISHLNMMSMLEDCWKILSQTLIPEADTTLFFLPFSHIIGKAESMATYVFGWKGCFAESIDQLMNNIQDVRPTLMFSVPRIFEKAYNKIHAALENDRSKTKKKLFAWALQTGRNYFEYRWKKKSPPIALKAEYALAKQLVFKKITQKFGGRLKFAVCGGAPLPKEIADFFEIAGLTILEGYGLTETCGPITLNTPDKHKNGTVGPPMSDVTLRFEEDGEILVRSDKVFPGYYKDDTRTAFTDEWFHTGDIGSFDSEGFLQITDRKKDLIITSAGKNIAPQKIENWMKSQKFINQFVVHGDQRNYLTALLTLDREQIIQYANAHQIIFSDYSGLIKNSKIQDLIQKTVDQVNEKLASYEQIKKFIILPQDFSIESGDLTPSLKIKRNVITRKYKSELDRMYLQSD